MRATSSSASGPPRPSRAASVLVRSVRDRERISSIASAVSSQGSARPGARAYSAPTRTTRCAHRRECATAAIFPSTATVRLPVPNISSSTRIPPAASPRVNPISRDRSPAGSVTRSKTAPVSTRRRSRANGESSSARSEPKGRIAVYRPGTRRSSRRPSPGTRRASDQPPSGRSNALSTRARGWARSSRTTASVSRAVNRSFGVGVPGILPSTARSGRPAATH